MRVLALDIIRDGLRQAIEVAMRNDDTFVLPWMKRYDITDFRVLSRAALAFAGAIAPPSSLIGRAFSRGTNKVRALHWGRRLMLHPATSKGFGISH